MTTSIRVDVYWNLHLRCWSVRHKGRVLRHADEVLLKDVTFVVQPAGRRRVLETKRKNVHAFARGTLVGCNLPACFVFDGEPVSYNPYHNETFVVSYSGEPVVGARAVYMRYHVVGYWKERWFTPKPVVLAKEVSLRCE